jgi:hypothetical protein
VQNSAFGSGALVGNTTGVGNSAFGTNALLTNTTGQNNVALGAFTGTLTTGSNNIIIANSGVVAENGAIRIGTLGTHVTCFIQGISGVTTGLAAIPVLVDANGQLGTISSKRSVKKDIQSIGDMSAKIYELDPVTFVYKSDATNTRKIGLIAEDVARVLPELVHYDANGNPVTVYYHDLPVLNLNELKKLAARIAVLEAALAAAA